MPRSQPPQRETVVHGSASEPPLLRAYWRKPVPFTPVWFMRQAGRSLPEYREARQDGNILEAVTHPELAAELTLQPVRRYGVDAAILFSDIMVPLLAAGIELEIVPGKGPVVREPFRSFSDLCRLGRIDPVADLSHVSETVSILSRQLPSEVPLIGFSGGPFTLACYLVDGGPSRDFPITKALMLGEPETWSKLMERLSELCASFLAVQIKAGARAIQVFDSWIGTLGPEAFDDMVAPFIEELFSALSNSGVPKVYFGINTTHLLTRMSSLGMDVIGLDWRIPLDQARRATGGLLALQGNLDPAYCLTSWERVRPEVDRILAEASGEPGHVFNLGHGVLPGTDPGILKELVDYVHEVTFAPEQEASSSQETTTRRGDRWGAHREDERGQGT
jgi:uroporphyrinogen decarboxylase